MKNNFRRAGKMLKLLEKFDIYDISVSEYSVNFQIHFNGDLCVLLQKLKFTYTISESGFVVFTRNYYRVVLTQ
jgi:hypothetical protein